MDTDFEDNPLIVVAFFKMTRAISCVDNNELITILLVLWYFVVNNFYDIVIIYYRVSKQNKQTNKNIVTEYSKIALFI